MGPDFDLTMLKGEGGKERRNGGWCIVYTLVEVRVANWAVFLCYNFACQCLLETSFTNKGERKKSQCPPPPFKDSLLSSSWSQCRNMH